MPRNAFARSVRLARLVPRLVDRAPFRCTNPLMIDRSQRAIASRGRLAPGAQSAPLHWRGAKRVKRGEEGVGRTESPTTPLTRTPSLFSARPESRDPIRGIAICTAVLYFSGAHEWSERPGPPGGAGPPAGPSGDTPSESRSHAFPGWPSAADLCRSATGGRHPSTLQGRKPLRASRHLTNPQTLPV